MLNWTDKQNGIDDILAEDINDIAKNLIEAQQQLAKKVVDQTYNPESENAQSGIAVAQAIANIEIPEGESVVVDQSYNPESENAQSGIAVAEALALTVDVKPSKIDLPFEWAGGKPGEYSAKLISIDKISNTRSYLRFEFGGSTLNAYVNCPKDELVTFGLEIGKFYLIKISGDAISSRTMEIQKFSKISIDQTYNPESENAQSGKAVAEALEAAKASGDFKGDKGDKGDKGETGEQGPQGVSGVYVGSGDMPEGYNVQIDPNGATIDKQNLMTDHTAMVDRRLNKVGWVESATGYSTNQKGIPVTEGKWYSIEVDDFPYQPLYISFKTADDITKTVQSTHIARYDGLVVRQAPARAKYMFISSKSEVFDKLKVYEGFSSKSPISKSLWTYGKKLMTLGDSLTEQRVWQTIVCGKLGFSSLTDLSKGGQKVAVFADRVTAENIADIDVVTVMGLFNSSDSAAGTVNDEASNAVGASICAGYKYIVEKLYSLKPTIQIILMTPHCPRADDVRNKAEAVIEVAKYYNIPYIDLYKEAGFNKRTFDIYLRDTVHSSYGVGGGYEQEAKVICGNMLKYLC